MSNDPEPKFQKIRYFFLNKFTDISTSEVSYIRMFPAYENNVSLKVIFEAILEQVILAKDFNTLEKICNYLSILANQKKEYHPLPEVTTNAFQM